MHSDDDISWIEKLPFIRVVGSKPRRAAQSQRLPWRNITIRFSEAEYQAISTLADMLGITRAELIRRATKIYARVIADRLQQYHATKAAHPDAEMDNTS